MSGEPRRPSIRKLGTPDLDMVEATPVVFRDRLFRFEYVRKNHEPNTTGHTFFLSANGVWLTESVPPSYLRPE